ncbi:hypothetical protein G5I_05278 [Acromyrmex echinatior]|uniref:Uncharacterized protein n=1 Tax=Acromyrmex echinatior TaxID=103372 RepID=F4WI09_ACREC|nr:hypothetical protein G5I_05278 [Acromyrmex echinatior]
MYKHTALKIESEDQQHRAAKTQRSDESENARERVLALSRRIWKGISGWEGNPKSRRNFTSQRDKSKKASALLNERAQPLYGKNDVFVRFDVRFRANGTAIPVQSLCGGR